MSAPRFVSEPITPVRGTATIGAMARGEPGLPRAFTWRDRVYEVQVTLSTGKTTGRDMGEQYVRRHTWKLVMDDGSTWDVYCTRQPPIGWYLRTLTPPIERLGSGPDRPISSHFDHGLPTDRRGLARIDPKLVDWGLTPGVADWLFWA